MITKADRKAGAYRIAAVSHLAGVKAYRLDGHPGTVIHAVTPVRTDSAERSDQAIS